MDPVTILIELIRQQLGENDEYIYICLNRDEAEMLVQGFSHAPLAGLVYENKVTGQLAAVMALAKEDEDCQPARMKTLGFDLAAKLVYKIIGEPGLRLAPLSFFTKPENQWRRISLDAALLRQEAVKATLKLFEDPC